MISSLAETEALLVSAIVPCTVPYLPMYALSVGSIPYKLGSLCCVQYVRTWWSRPNALWPEEEANGSLCENVVMVQAYTCCMYMDLH